MSDGDGPAKRHLSVDRFHRSSPYKSHKTFRPHLRQLKLNA
jgi:hypothetical protein